MSTSTSPERGKVTIQTLQAKKARGDPITMLTAYDYPTSLALDRAGIDVILVGDSLGMVVLGYENTLPVTMQDMLHHCRAVARGASRAHLVGDMPFMSYQVSAAEAVRNAGSFLQQGGMDAAVSTLHVAPRFTAFPHIAKAVTRTSRGTSCPASVLEPIQSATPLPKTLHRTSPRRVERSSSLVTSISSP